MITNTKICHSSIAAINRSVIVRVVHSKITKQTNKHKPELLNQPAEAVFVPSPPPIETSIRRAQGQAGIKGTQILLGDW